MKRLIIAFLAVFCLAEDASAACSQGRFLRPRALLRSVLPVNPVFPRLRLAVAPQAKLVGLSGGCIPVFETPAIAPKPMPKPEVKPPAKK